VVGPASEPLDPELLALEDASGKPPVCELDPDEFVPEGPLDPEEPLEEVEPLDEPGVEPALEDVEESLVESVAVSELPPPPGEASADGFEPLPGELEPHAAATTATAARTETKPTWRGTGAFVIRNLWRLLAWETRSEG